MNLYRILFRHYAPKDSHSGITTYLLANNDEEVYTYIDSINYGMWSDKNEECPKLNIYDDEYIVIGTESFKEKMIRIKGLMFDEDYELTDLYYGKTLYGWEVIKEDVNVKDYKELIELGIFIEI